MSSWRVSSHSNSECLMSDDDLIEQIQYGQIKPCSLVWKRGMSSWEPIKAHFGLYFKDSSTSSTCHTAPSLPAYVESPSTGKDQKFESSINRTIKQRSKTLAFYSALSVSSFLIFIWIYSCWDGSEANAKTLGLSLIITIASGILWTIKLWQEGRRQTVAKQCYNRGKQKLAAVFLGLFIISFTTVAISQVALHKRIFTERKAYNEYTIEVDIASKSMVIKGCIGPYFSSTIKRNFDSHPEIDTLIIDSPGGLIDEALKAAKIIEEQHITVIARKTCNSAAFIIFMAGDNRLADYNMNFGFHAASPLPNIDPKYLDFETLGNDADEYISKRGTPQEIIDISFSKGSKELFPVSSIKLLDIGVVSELVEIGQAEHSEI
jgi:hypothetical protein